MNRLIALASATVLAGSLLVATPADANVHKRVKVVGGYGHVVVYDYYWHWGYHERHQSVYPGHRSPASWSVDYVRAVGETRCAGGLYWTKPSPDEWEGRDMWVVADHVTVRVSKSYCG